MTLAITHTKVVVTADDGTSEVGSDEWNDTHTITGSVAVSELTGGATGMTTFLASGASSDLKGAMTDETGSGALVFANTPTLVSPVLGTPTSGTLTNCTIPTTGVSDLGSNVATFLKTPSSANLISAVTDETGTGALVFANTPTLVTPILGAATATSIVSSSTVTAPKFNVTSTTTASAVSIIPSTSITSPYTLKLPVDDGTSNQVLATDGSGVLSWLSVSTSTSGGAGTPGGSDTQVQYNNASAFGGMSGTAWDDTNKALTVAGSTALSTSKPILNLSQGWNDGAVTFTGLKFNVTNTASVGTSKVFDFQIGGTSFFYSDTTDGSVTIRQVATAVTNNIFSLANTAGTPTIYFNPTNATLGVTNQAGQFFITTGNINATINWGGGTVYVGDEATRNLAIKNGTSSTGLRVYNTTDAAFGAPSANYERGVFDWTTTANVLTIGTQAAGTGTLRGMAFTLATIGTTNPGVAGQLYRSGNAVQISTG